MESAMEVTLWLRALFLVTSLIQQHVICHNEAAGTILDSGPRPLESHQRTSMPYSEQCANIEKLNRFDCFPRGQPTAEECVARRCCWLTHLGNQVDIDPGVPYCFYPKQYGSYRFTDVSYKSLRVTAFLELVHTSPYPNDISRLKMDVNFETNTRLHVKITDASKQRFEPPFPVIKVRSSTAGNPIYQFELDKEKPGFKVVRKNNNHTVFDCQDVGGLTFANQFLQISAMISSYNIYGLGEHRNHFLLSTKWNSVTLFNHDSPPYDKVNLYGSHPFYLAMEPGGNSHGVLLLNSNAMDIILQPAPAITYRTIGGVFDFYFFLGPTPASVVSQYAELVGQPHMPPYWSLGFHLCRYGYETLNETRMVWNRTRMAGIPLDTQWNDIDYMDNFNDFTYNTTTYNGLPEFVKEVQGVGMHYVPILDPGVSASEAPGTYPPYDEGIKGNVFLKDSGGKQPFVGKVWNPVSTVFPDFTNPNTFTYWTDQIRHQHDKQFPFDGLWIDMNEPSNFLDGSLSGCPNTTWDNPPYIPGVQGGKLWHRTACMSAVHHDGLHYDFHNMFGLLEAIGTNRALRTVRNKRPFIISRSTFVGHGRYAGHWTGDISSTWDDMRHTIGDILSFNILAIPMVGADICGFLGNTTVALCRTWSQLGAFYPFARNHNMLGAIDQDPVALGPAVVESARRSLLLRYSLLPYLYTLFYQAHLNGTTVARPLFFEFPDDEITYSINSVFLWGSALLIAPVLEEGATNVKIYLPKGQWYNFYTKKLINSEGCIVNIPAPKHTPPLIVRGGHIIPSQKPDVTTTLSRQNPMSLIVAPHADGTAFGMIYWDDGDSLDTDELRAFDLISYSLNGSTLENRIVNWDYDTPLILENVSVLGVKFLVTNVLVNGELAQYSYRKKNQNLVISGIKLPLKSEFTITWS